MNFAEKKILFKTFAQIFRLLFAKKTSKNGKYQSIILTDDEIEKEVYKKYLGGGGKSWESRGAFQLYFLQKMGMAQTSKVLDIGCGPGRASKHLIGFLNKDNYCGVDYNPDFIKAAFVMAKRNRLAAKNPGFLVINNFNVKGIDPDFNYAIAFSVLNHCNVKERKNFFRKIHVVLSEGGKLYISHARWFDVSYIENTNFMLTNQFESHDFDITKFGWRNRWDIFPIIELERYL